MMKFNKKQATFKRPKNLFLALISCLLLALAFSAQSVFAAGSSPTPPKISASADENGNLAYHGGTDIELVDDGAATKEVVWEYAVTSVRAEQAPEYGWSTEKPKRNMGIWTVWYRTAGNDKYEALCNSFGVSISKPDTIYINHAISDLTYTGKPLSLLFTTGAAGDSSLFTVTTATDSVTLEKMQQNINQYDWVDEPTATEAGDYKVWVKDRYNSVVGYLPVTIYSENGEVPETPSETKLYIYIRAVNAD